MQGKPGNTTISEAQLIGRGARYCPFQIEKTDSKYQRKYDKDIENELRICEELYYHSAYNPKYIQELNTALQEIGIKAKETREIPLQLKLDFKETDFFKHGLIFINEQIKHNREDIVSLPSTITEHTFPIDLATGAVIVTGAFDNKTNNSTINTKRKDVLLNDLGYSVIRKAMARIEFYQFNNLKSFLPNLSSVREFIESDKYLAKLKCELTGQ
jgi:type III restriction enzyme